LWYTRDPGNAIRGKLLQECSLNISVNFNKQTQIHNNLLFPLLS